MCIRDSRYDIKFDENKPMKEIVISGEGDAKIRGDQHRLRQPEPSGEPTGAPLSDAQRKAREDAHRASPLTPVPHDGKLTATYGTNRAEVLLDLPTVGRIKADIAGGNSASEEAEAASKLDDIPAGVWVTCGQVARDGFALQLKLKRGRVCKHEYCSADRCGLHVRDAVVTVAATPQPRPGRPRRRCRCHVV